MAALAVDISVGLVPGMAAVQGMVSSSNRAMASTKTVNFGESAVFGTIFAMRIKVGRTLLLSNSRSLSMHGAPGPVAARAVAMQDSLTDEDSEGIGEMGLGQRELKDYPPGLKRYETMAVLRPDISEEQRLSLTQRYEEAIIAGGGLDVEMFNRGMQPLAYNIKTKNMSGVSSRYLDGIYLLFTYVTKPESQLALQKRLNADDDIIRSTTFKLKV